MKKSAIDHGVKMQLYVEMDPSERYGRFKDVLGKGAMKSVYRAFDEFLGMEVAWNQVKLDTVFKSPEDLQRLYSEVLLLKNLNHDSIMRFRTSWIDVERRTFNFITEMFTSGNLREYRKKYKRVNIRAVKDWARQILEGLDYLHAHDPPVIHRDLKCDNIFVNGHLGQVKIGDLGLAAILRGSQHAHSVIGTPEFMAPELYEEEYDELVDIYSFGMCVLEMLTSEYPYNECSNPAQIYKKVTSGKLPESFKRIEDAEARRFVGRCLDKASNRPSARELLMDPFFTIDQELPPASCNNISSCPKAALISEKLEEAFLPLLDVSKRSTDMLITGTMNADDDAIFLKVHISDKNGPARNIYFPFEITSDTPLDVAMEMVKELEITEWEADEIADMIDAEISRLVPSWKDLQIHQQQSFNYVEYDNDDNNHHHPFYSTSSISSSQASLPICPFSFHHDPPNYSLHDLLQEEANAHDDASSQSSSCCSSNYHNHKYFSANEDDFISSPHKEELNCISKIQKFTRFGPEGGISRNCSNLNVLDSNTKPQQKIVKTGSLVDIRSQLLHQTLVDEINKRRLFKTIATVEQIGYHDPGKSMEKSIGTRGIKR